MEEKEVQKDLKIPANASDRDDYIQGIGAKEVCIIVIALIIVIILAIVTYVITKSMPGAVLMALFFLSITIMMIIRDSINENMIDKIKILIRYLRMQKIYEYVQADILKGQEEENATEE